MHLVLWGSNWNGSTGAAVREQIEKMFSGISGTPYQETFSQYFDASGQVSSKVSVNAWVDTRVTAPTNVDWTSVTEEFNWAINSHSGSGWSKGPNEQFMVIPAPGTTYAAEFHGFCAYHTDDGTSTGIYDFVPYMGDEPFTHSCQSYDTNHNASNVTSMLASHEYAEAATDPLWDSSPGWKDREGYEISDICISHDDKLENGSWVQGQYSDHQNACSLGDKEPPHLLALTEPATGVSADRAQLNGTIYPERSSTTYWFEYGTNAEYGTKVPTGGALVGESGEGVPVSAEIRGLETGRVYHYRVVATSSAGTVYGEDLTARPSTWTLRPQSEPKSEGDSWLGGVSCGDQVSCIAVGRYWNGGAKGLAYVGAGSIWRWTSMPFDVDGNVTDLEGVSCSSGSACTAVGELNTTIGGSVNPAAIRWNGSTWSAQHVPTPPNTTYSRLLGVSCPTSSECVAVGFARNGSNGSNMYATRWNGSSWSTMTMPALSFEIEKSILEDVSCPQSTSFCVAVGWANTANGGGARKVTMSLYGNSWSEETAATAGKFGTLAGVSCTSAKFCIQVGQSERNPSSEVWNGSEWSSQTHPKAQESTGGGHLEGVSCSSETSCVAVGSANSSYNKEPFTLSERWDGTAWTEESTPRESIRTTNHFNRVDCATGRECVAVGASNVSGAHSPILATYGQAPTPTKELTFGTTGAENGQLKRPQGVALDSSGNVWVADSNNNRIEEFNPKGEFVRKFGELGAGNGQLNTPSDIAFTASGNLWVTDKGNDRVEEFSPEGKYLSQFGSAGSENGHFNNPWGIAIGSNGYIWVTDWATNRLQEFTEAGAFVRSVGKTGSGAGEFSSPAGVAVDSGGSVWVVDSGNQRVQHFSSTGTYLGQFGTKGTGNGEFEGPRAIDILPSGALAVTDRPLKRVQEFSPAGEYLVQFGPGSMAEPEGIAAGGDGNIYVPSASGNRVEKWRIPSPQVVTLAASGIIATGAILNGSVNPSGLATRYTFEYGKTTDYGKSAPLTDELVGSGKTTVNVSKEIAGLRSGTTYHYRIVASNAEGTSYGSDQAFTTP